MTREVRTLVKGTALHFFDAGLGQKGSDKFYRAMIHEKPDGRWIAIMHWGRDGTEGQAKWEEFATESDARKATEKKVKEKMRHGYEVLGRGDAIMILGGSLTVVGHVFADSVCERDPDKTRMTGGIIIHEEPDLMDLLG